MALSFAFDPQKGETPATIKEKRDLIRALMGAQRAPQNVGEGLNALGDGIVAAVLDKRANAAEQAGMESFQSDWGALFPEFPEAPVAPGGGGGSVAPDLNWDASSLDPSIPAGIKATAEAVGIDPIDLATAISYETGGTFDPTKRGPTTKWGQHRGFIQFGEPQAQQHGVNWDDPINSQLGPNGAVASYLKAAGVTPGMGLLDVYSAINAGAPGLYDRSDAAAGGAPGTVRDKVEKQMAAHRAKALAMFGGGQTASLDPSAGMSPVQAQTVQAASPTADPMVVAGDEASTVAAELAMAQQDPQNWTGASSLEAPMTAGVGDPMAVTPQGNRVVQALLNPQPMGGQPMPMQPEAPQMAQAAPPVAARPIPPMAGGPAPERPSPSLQSIMRASQNPFAPQAAQGVLKILLEQELQKNDPMRQLEMQNMQGEIADRDRRFGLDQDKFGFEREKFEWEKGKPTDDIREYEFYANQEIQAGRQPLGPLEWDIARRRAGATNVTTNVGGGPDDSELRKKLDGKTGELWATYLEQGANSAALSQDMQVLDELIKIAPQGPLEGRLAEAFPGFSSAGDAFQSIVKRVAPTLRAPGSGSTSDIEYDGMLRSLPALRNRPEANLMIAEIMKAKAAINIERAEIANEYAQGELSAKRARQLMGELDKRSIMSPEMKRALEGLGGAPESTAPLEGDVVDGYRFRGGNPGDPSSWERVE